MFQSRQNFLRVFSRSFILFTFFGTFHTFAQETEKAPQKWFTYWNGNRKRPTSSKSLRPSVHLPEDAADITWELSSNYEGNAPVSNSGIPGFTRIPQTDKLFFSRFFEDGIKVKIEKLMASSYIHYYGVSLVDDPDKIIYWIAGVHLKRVAE